MSAARPALWLLLALSLLVVGAGRALADDVRPLSLTVEQSARDQYDVRFQVPMRGNARLRVGLALPDGAVIDEASLDRRIAGDSLIERFTFTLEGGLVGRTLGVQGLALKSRNALLTVRPGDGRVLRAVLGGTRPTYTVEPVPEVLRSHWTTDVATAARAGLHHGLTSPAHLLFAIALLLAFVGTPFLVSWVLGLASFLIAAVIGAWVGPFPGLTVAFADALLALVAVLAARELLIGRQRHLVFLSLVAGLAHGVADTGTAPLLASANALGLDLAHLLVGGAVLGVLTLLRTKAPTRVLSWCAGVLGVAAAVVLAAAPEIRPAVAVEAALPMPLATSEAPAGPAPIAQGMVTDVETYLDVGVFETRVEVLGRFEAMARWLGLPATDGGAIEIAAQTALLERIQTALLERIRVDVDGEAVTPDAMRAGFATQDGTGTYLRDEPSVEVAADALVGLTYAFRTPAIPSAVSLKWTTFPTGLGELRARVIDPEISREVVVRPDAPRLSWTNELTEAVLPPVAAVQVRPVPVPFPVLSLLLVIAALLAGALLFKRTFRPTANIVVRVGLTLALLVAPWLSVDVSAAFPTRAAPTTVEARAITGALLDNVYRAFNERDENAVYDRLALSLGDETREAAYLQSRRALAFERVGGARTHVDAVELTDLEDVKPTGDGGFEATARWTVAGSVTHFGHRHLRQNAYRAHLQVVPRDGTWQLVALEIDDLERTR